MDILYTDTDQIRSCLLLPEEDLPESVFSQDLYERELTLHLDDWVPDHSSLVATTTTPADRRISFAIQNYCAYWCAYKVAGTLAVSIPQQISDGKNMLQRGTDYLQLMSAMMSGMSEARAIITAGLGSTTATRVSQVSVVGLAVDPVTG
jgi:hypothetical protein